MNYYSRVINNTINYIEENMHEKLSIEDISKVFCVSEYHFNRMFKTVTGKTLKQYILGRKLTLAYERLMTWYAQFVYNGNMLDMRETFTDDLYKWIMLKEIKLDANGVGMLNIFGKKYSDTEEVHILVPIKRNQKIQQKKS